MESPSRSRSLRSLAVVLLLTLLVLIGLNQWVRLAKANANASLEPADNSALVANDRLSGGLLSTQQDD